MTLIRGVPLYIVLLMHYGDHGAEFGVLTKFSDFSKFNVTTDTVNPYKSILSGPILPHK